MTYIRNVLPHLAVRDDVRATILVSAPLRGELQESGNITLMHAPDSLNAAMRFWSEQRSLPRLIRASGANVLLSTGNFAVLRSPVPQILLSRNALYTSADFVRDVRQRGDYRLWLDTEIKAIFAKWSVGAADRTVAPSAAFADDLNRWTGKDVIHIYHGFDQKAFFNQTLELPRAVSRHLQATHGSLRLLFVSHYNYYRNFETLLRATALLKKKLHPRKVRLILTCRFIAEENPGEYSAEPAAELVKQLQISDEVVELGSLPYGLLHHLYRSCDCYVTPAYAETFAHPLVEAMASELPVVASDLPVHREICGDSALYFPCFSAELLAQRVIEAGSSAELRNTMRECGIRRSRDFSWRNHVDEILTLARSLVPPEPPQILEGQAAGK